MAVDHIVEAELAHFTVLWTELTATIKLAVVDLLLGVFALAVDELSVFSPTT